MDVDQVENLFLMRSPTQILIIVATYLFLVLKIGPHFMAKRKPFDLFAVIRVYNILQIIANIILFTTAVRLFSHYSIWRSPSDEDEYELRRDIRSVCHLYLLSKISDLLETFFFVLRKKTEQVSFLHVFHHVGIVGITWTSCKYLGGIYDFLPAGINTFVHICMYIYYLQSSRGKTINKFWKKCLTAIQIGHQALAFVLYVLILINTKCSISRLYLILAIGYMGTVVGLFLKFYKNSYMRRQSSKEAS